MATDWAADIKKHVTNADDAAIAGIIKHCGISLHRQDSSMVSFTDKAETDRVKAGFLTKKLGVTDEAKADAAIKAVGEKLKGSSRKYRPTVYYMLADHFGKLDLFKK
ncbi:hypothetical protein CGZ93_05855 [Enemella dayhoffiae]|uniref:DUF2853 family protein n=1 Tax=Enemella dayhoffiae TaxID=2016507 RepID=A0A255H820_9ACTN|nr:DUF2853 family protein [Enemella dayhoffiae]OYO23466.1 hypothetical protein CGZ93_05855 [Enemella dayhoffiae]